MLGGLRADARGVDVPLGGKKQRAVFALLLLRAGEVVSVDELVDALWADSPGPGARRTLQVYVSNLRQALARAGGPPARDRLARSGTGYVLSAETDEVDARLFERLAAAG